MAAGSTSLGIKAANGVVLATEKKLRTTLVDEASLQKISLLTPNIGVAYSGMGPDSRVLIRKARKQAQVNIPLLTPQVGGLLLPPGLLSRNCIPRCACLRPATLWIFSHPVTSSASLVCKIDNELGAS